MARLKVSTNPNRLELVDNMRAQHRIQTNYFRETWNIGPLEILQPLLAVRRVKAFDGNEEWFGHCA
jgi:hypothetical protein